MREEAVSPTSNGDASPVLRIPSVSSRRSSLSVRTLQTLYQGSCIRSPIWIAVLFLVLEIFPKGMTMSWLSTLQAQQFGNEAYWITTASQVLINVVNAPTIALAGYLSQPHRLGRKNVILYLTILATIANAVPALTTNAYTVVASQLACAVLGADRFNTGAFTIILAFVTDWAPPAEKGKYFGIILGAMFGTIAFSPLIPPILGFQEPHDKDPYAPQWHQIAMLSAFTKLISPVFVLIFFPRNVPTVAEPPTPAALSRRFSATPGFLQSDSSRPQDGLLQEPQVQTTGSSRKTVRDMCDSARYLLVHRFAATMIYLMVNFTDAAVQDVVFMYLIKERGFGNDDLNALISIIGFCGFLFQCFGVPAVSACGVSNEIQLVVGVLAMVGHFAVYAFVANKVFILALEPCGSLGYVAVIAAMAIVSGSSEKEDIPRDQGTLFGTLQALKLLAACVGPFLLAACNVFYPRLPAPLNWPGFGFSILSIIMLWAGILAIRLWCLSRVGQQVARTCSEDPDLKPETSRS